MKTFENDFIAVNYDEHQDLLIMDTKPENRYMQDGDFRFSVVQILKLIRAHQPQHCLMKLADLEYIIVPSTQEFVNEQLFGTFALNKLKKLAIIKPKDITSFVSIAQTVSEDSQHFFKIELFEDGAGANAWLGEESVVAE